MKSPLLDTLLASVIARNGSDAVPDWDRKQSGRRKVPGARSVTRASHTAWCPLARGRSHHPLGIAVPGIVDDAGPGEIVHNRGHPVEPSGFKTILFGLGSKHDMSVVSRETSTSVGNSRGDPTTKKISLPSQNVIVTRFVDPNLRYKALYPEQRLGLSREKDLSTAMMV